VNWYILWNDDTMSVWPVSHWTAAQVMTLTNVRDVILA
jgi:hypothetical protein